MQCSVKISFLGDISLNNRYEELAKDAANPFSNISKQLFCSDLVVGNLECLLYGNEVNFKKKPRIGTTLQAYSLLKLLNIKIVSLAHNHYYDNLFDGFVKTTTYLNENDICYLGANIDQANSRKPLFLKFNDLNFCFLNFMTKDTNPNVPEYPTVFANYYDKKTILKDIDDYKKICDHLVLLFHWGGQTEGYSQPDWYQTKDARQFIDAGADLIIGGHSHTLQPFEIYKGKYIFYSLGNFCFDDILFEGKIIPWNEKSLYSVIVKVEFNKSSYSVNLTPIATKNNRVYINHKSLKVLKKRNRIFKFIFKNIILWELYYLYQRTIKKVLDLLFLEHISFSAKCKMIFSKIKKRF